MPFFLVILLDLGILQKQIGGISDIQRINTGLKETSASLTYLRI